MSDVLVDSSVWIDFFRGDRPTVVRLDSLLADDRVAVTGPIVAEVASGTLDLASFTRVRRHFAALNLLDDPPGLWDRIAEARFTLARQGFQAHLVDLAIAITGYVHGHSLLTRDKDFSVIGRVIAIDLEVY